MTTPGGHARAGFRPDIEGLRALAVLPIVANHALVHGFGGGFIGVDIFFVISGYLISGILARDIANGRYSIASFYRRRVLRLFPALFVMLGVVTAVALVAMTPVEFVAYARSLLATIFFVSNVHFYDDTGYFTAAASVRPLLHTWSLAIEEQFYIFWPFLLVWSTRRGPAHALWAIAIVTGVSFALAIWMVTADMSAAFYLIPFRAWELGVGGLLALWPTGGRRLPRWLAQAAALGGLAGIAWCIYSFKEPMSFPGWNAVPACLGAVAIIGAGGETIVARLLSLRPVRFFGLISYSLYLWHWPVIVFARLWFFLPPTLPVVVGEIVVSIVLAAVSYWLIEAAPRAKLSRLRTSQVLWGGALGMVGVGMVAGVVMVAHGFPARYSPAANAIASVLDRDEERSYRRGSCFVVGGEDRFDAAHCLARQRPGPTLLLVGDSTAAHLWPGLASQARGYDVRQATMIGCSPKIFADMQGLPCNAFFRSVLTRWAPRNRPAAILIAGNWQMKDIAIMQRTLAALRSLGQRVIVVGPMPRYESSLPRLLFFGQPPGQPNRANDALDPVIWPIDRGMRRVVEAGHATYISPLDLLCVGGKCRVYASRDVPLQFDTVHLTSEGSNVVVRLMLPQIDGALGNLR